MARPHITPNSREILYVQDSAGGANASATYLTATAHALDVNVVSGGGAGGTQYQELATTSPATGTLALGRYLTSLPTLTNGQMNEPMLDSSSRLIVSGAVTVSGSVTANAGTNLNTSALALAATQTDKSQFTKLTDGTDTALITVAGELNTIATAQPGVDIGDVTINNAAGAAAVNIQDGGNSITVDYATTGSGTATGALRVELANNGTGVMATVGAVTAITNALPAGTNAIGKLAANSGVDIGDVDVTSVLPGTATTNLGKAEDAGHTTGDVGVFALGVRNDTLASVTTTTADYSQLSTDTSGIVMVAGAPRALKGTFQVQLSNTTSETTILAATASTFHDLYGLILANTGATTTKVSIRDDTAGTVRMIIEVPTLETRGFMLPVDSAIPQTAVNKNLTAQCASATTALEVTGLYVSRV